MHLTASQKEICKQAVERFGRRHQVMKVAEELRELAYELELAANGLGTAAERIIDERADVALVLYQLDEILLPLSASKVPERIQIKVEKLQKYLEVGTDGRHF